MGVELQKIPLKIMLTLVHAYRYAISPWLGNRCRFYPSCSEYAIETLKKYGIIKGLWRTSWRLLRCHPFNSGGYDPAVSAQTPFPIKLDKKK
jgi:putative membrane protein insertion efficiency factor